MTIKAKTGEEIFAAMTKVVEKPGYPYLKHYREDFYKIDREVILNEFGPTSSYIWVVRPNGTYLVRIGVHAKNNEWALASIDSGVRDSSLGCEIYLIDGAGIRKVTAAEAKAITMTRTHFRVANKQVRDLNDQIVAVFDVRKHFKPGDGNTYADVMFQSSRLEQLSLSDLHALRDIGMSEAVIAASSFFVKANVFTVNGHCMQELISAKLDSHAAVGCV